MSNRILKNLFQVCNLCIDHFMLIHYTGGSRTWNAGSRSQLTQVPEEHGPVAFMVCPAFEHHAHAFSRCHSRWIGCFDIACEYIDAEFSLSMYAMASFIGVEIPLHCQCAVFHVDDPPNQVWRSGHLWWTSQLERDPPEADLQSVRSFVRSQNNV